MSADRPYREIETLRERLSRLSESRWRINESLDMDTALRGRDGQRPIRLRPPPTR